MSICNQTPDVVKYTNYCDPAKAQLDSDFANYNQLEVMDMDILLI